MGDEDKLIGTVASGRYKVLRLLGQGGMGSVYEVEHLLIGRHFALKTLHPEFARNGDAISRFHREARAAAAIGNEHIIEVNDMGNLDDGSPFIVLEMLDGEDLGHVLQRTGPMTLERAIKIARQACGALGCAHAKGIVHRDIKPDNIFILQRQGADFVKLLDFGISKIQESALDLSSGALTKTGMVVGTPYYMAPEQIAADRSIDARADVYAMGAVVFEMLMGRVPFEAPSYPALVIKVMQESPPAIRQFRTDVPPELEAAVHRALAKTPEARWRSIDEFADTLARFESLPSAPPQREAAPKSLVMVNTPGTWEVGAESIRVPKTSKPARTIYAAGLLAASALAFWGVWRSDSVASPSTQAHEVKPAPVIARSSQPSAAHADSELTAASAQLARPASPALPLTASAQPPVAEPSSPLTPPPSALTVDPKLDSPPTRRDQDQKHKHRSGPAVAAAKTPARVPAAPIPAPRSAPAVATRSLEIANERRAAISVSLECDAKPYAANVGAGSRAVLSIPAVTCAVVCRGLGNPRCPLTIRADTRALKVE